MFNYLVLERCWCNPFGRSGFNDVFPLATLAAFHEDELEAMLCGMGEAWSVEMLADTIKFDHGFAAPCHRG